MNELRCPALRPNILIGAPKQNGKALTIKRAHKLADGRDLFYFDDRGSSLPAERKADARPAGERNRRRTRGGSSS